MKRYIALFLMCVLLFSPCIFAQTTKIIDVKGEVLVKKEPSASWEKAAVNTFLKPEAEIKTGKDSKCTLIFDDAMKNVLTLKENSQITIKETKPVNISLPQGRVFALIEEVARVEKFEIRTPTAVAGVRGTGESVEFNNENTMVRCFKGIINVQGIDEKGGGQDPELGAGWGINVGSGGTMGEPFKLGKEDFNEWEEFTDYVDDITGKEDEKDTAVEELGGEQQQDYRWEGFEKARRDEEGKTHREGGRQEEQSPY